MFKQLHINITLADALILIPKYWKMIKALLSNKEKLLELANTPSMKIAQREIKYKTLADLGTIINLMPLSVWKKLGLPELISTRMTLELAIRAICTPAGIARDVFVPVGKFTFPADFVIVYYESDPRVPLILGDNVLTDKVINLYSTKDLPPPHNVNPLSGSTTSSSSSPNHFLEEFADELALITFPPRNDDIPFDIESNLKEIEYLKARWRFFLALLERTSISWMFLVSISISHEQIYSGVGSI
nr:reverse transcriptase domain-containing protein [Tanacetum cinerariifolium]